MLVFLVYKKINFAGQNASSVILDCMPWEYHQRYVAIGALTLFLTLFAFIAANREQSLMLSIATMISFLIVMMLIGLAVSNEITSKMIVDRLEYDDKNNYNCFFVTAQFS